MSKKHDWPDAQTELDAALHELGHDVFTQPADPPLPPWCVGRQDCNGDCDACAEAAGYPSPDEEPWL